MRTCSGRGGGGLASRRILRTTSRARRGLRVTGDGDKVIMGKVRSITIHFSGYYGPVPNSRVMNFIAEKHKVAVRHASYIGILGVSRASEAQLVRTR